MVRGIYTAASGMITQQRRLDALANNLANVDTSGYKRDVTIHKAFPELQIRRFRDEGVVNIPLSETFPPLGSVDKAPVVGTLGTGVETNEIFTVFEQGELELTENPFDLALHGEGFFAVMTPEGERYTRNGGFILGQEGILMTKEGYPVLGENGIIRIQENNFIVDSDGKVFQNRALSDDPNRLVGDRENEWDEPVLVDRLRIVDVHSPRYLQKQGSSLWRTTWESGDAEVITEDRPVIHQGMRENSNVDPVTEMVRMIEVQRAYEANQRVIQAQDSSSDRLINQVLRR